VRSTSPNQAFRLAQEIMETVDFKIAAVPNFGPDACLCQFRG
jgi:hypothetical protein